MIRGVFLLLIFLGSYPASSASIWSKACSLFLIGKNKSQPPAGSEQLEAAFRRELSREAIFYRTRLTGQVAQLDFLAGKPFSLLIEPDFAINEPWLRPVNLQVFVDPELMSWNWFDDQPANAQGGLYILFDDISIRLESGEYRKLSDVMKVEIQLLALRVRDHEPLRPQIHLIQATDHPVLKFSGSAQNQTLLWIDGVDLLNFQVKRFLLVALESAIKHLQADPAYSRSPTPL